MKSPLEQRAFFINNNLGPPQQAAALRFGARYSLGPSRASPTRSGALRHPCRSLGQMDALQNGPSLPICNPPKEAVLYSSNQFRFSPNGYKAAILAPPLYDNRALRMD